MYVIIPLAVLVLALSILLGLKWKQLLKAQVRLKRLGAKNVEQAQAKLDALNAKLVQQQKEFEVLKKNLEENEKTSHRKYSESTKTLITENEELQQTHERLDTLTKSELNKLGTIRDMYASIENAVKQFYLLPIPPEYFRALEPKELAEIDSIAPSIILTLRAGNYKESCKEMSANRSLIDELLTSYEDKYATKANQTVFRLMVIAMKAELQNVLYSIKSHELEASEEAIQNITRKYLAIVSEGNQSIAGTVRKFIGQLEQLFLNAVRIEYACYVNSENEELLQKSIQGKIQMEAEQFKRLEQRESQVDEEAESLMIRIDSLQDEAQSIPVHEESHAEVSTKIYELRQKLIQLGKEKRELEGLRQGTAGTIYVASNLGSFGEQVFKIGLSRDYDPRGWFERISSHGVPFRYDIHSLIYSEDAQALLEELYVQLDGRRVNKVDQNKDFFSVSLDEIALMVMDLQPKARFVRTMAAEEYHRSLSVNDGYQFESSSDGLPE